MARKCLGSCGITLLSSPPTARGGGAHRGPGEAGRCGLWLEPRVQSRIDQEDVLELRDRPTPADAPADRSLAAPLGTHPSLLPNSFLEEKETMLLAPQTLQSHVSQNPHSVQKGGETQAGCKLFESFTRRGIFPVNFFFFLFKVCFKRKRARKKS